MSILILFGQPFSYSDFTSNDIKERRVDMSEKINESILNDEIREHLKENRIDHMTYLDRKSVV